MARFLGSRADGITLVGSHMFELRSLTHQTPTTDEAIIHRSNVLDTASSLATDQSERVTSVTVAEYAFS